MIILVINAGSSSLKYQLLDSKTGEVKAKGVAERIGLDAPLIKHTRNGNSAIPILVNMPNHAYAVKAVLEILTSEEHGVISSMSEIDAIGHRVVHGGEAFADSALITPDVMGAIRECVDLAPLHNPANITGIEACAEAMPGIPQVAVFDTAFHQTMPAHAYMYALPYAVYKDFGVRRYGFHGTSHQFVAKRAATLMGKPIEELKIVTCHLGNGSSITAVDGGKSIDTSMGLTPLAGVPMGTRSGDIDPAIIKFLLEKEDEDMNMNTVQDIDRIMNKQSGVLGISGVSSDFRDLYDAAESGNDRAQLAIDMFAYSVKKFVGAYAAAMNGLDAIVFTAGVGENTPDIRERVCKGLSFMGVEIDVEKNDTRDEGDMATANSRVRIFNIPTNEELVIAQDTERLVNEAQA